MIWWNYLAFLVCGIAIGSLLQAFADARRTGDAHRRAEKALSDTADRLASIAKEDRR